MRDIPTEFPSRPNLSALGFGNPTPNIIRCRIIQPQRPEKLGFPGDLLYVQNLISRGRITDPDKIRLNPQLNLICWRLCSDHQFGTKPPQAQRCGGSVWKLGAPSPNIIRSSWKLGGVAPKNSQIGLIFRCWGWVIEHPTPKKIRFPRDPL